MGGARGNEEATDLRIGQAKYYALDPSARAAFAKAMQQARFVEDNETLVEAALGFHRQSINLRVERVEATAMLVELLEGRFETIGRPVFAYSLNWLNAQL